MTKSRNVLVVGVAADRYARVAPVLRRREFDVDRFPGTAGAIELLDQVRFAGLVVAFPLPDGNIEQLLAAIRASPANSRTAVAVLHPPEAELEARDLLDRGADHLLGWDATATEYEHFVASALGVPPRGGTRLPMRLRVTLTAGGGEVVAATTENLSATGMLVECRGGFLTGDRLRFALDLGPGTVAIEGLGEIVRVADPAFDRLEGYGVHFREMDQSHRELLEMLLEDAASVRRR